MAGDWSEPNPAWLRGVARALRICGWLVVIAGIAAAVIAVFAADPQAIGRAAYIERIATGGAAAVTGLGLVGFGAGLWAVLGVVDELQRLRRELRELMRTRA